jgi:hypothetical protein
MAAPVDALAAALRGADFKADNKLRDQLDREAGEHPTYEETTADARARGQEPRMVRGGTGLRLTGPYEVLGVFRHGEVTVTVEQNTDQAGPHEPLAVIDGPNGYRAACDPADHELVLAEAAAAVGDFSRHHQRELRAGMLRAGAEPTDDPNRFTYRGISVVIQAGLTLALYALTPLVLVPLLVVGLIRPRVVTNATKKAWLDAWYSAAALGAPATHYFGLSTTTPAEDGTNVTEPSGGAYARVAKTAGTTDFALSTAADPTLKRNTTVITWPAATASWGTVTHCTQHDAATAGNVKDWQALGTAQAISSGTTASLAVNAWESSLT